MPQADTCISKIFSILQDLKIAMKLINTAAFDLMGWCLRKKKIFVGTTTL